MTPQYPAAYGDVHDMPRWLTSVAVFLLGAISLAVPSGYSLGAGILLVAGVGLLIRRRLPYLARHDLLVMAGLLGYALMGIAEAWWDAQGSSGIDKPIRFVLAIPVIWWVIAYPPRLAFLWSGIAAGALTAGSWAVWQKTVEGVWRAEGHTHVIQFGNLSMLLGVFCLAGLGWAAVQRKRNVWVVLLLLGAGAGVLASLLSGSRGGWVGIPVILWVLYKSYGSYFSAKLKITYLGLLIVAGMAVYWLPQTGVESRVHDAIYEVKTYVSGENRASSIGARFEMWRGAALLIQEKPLMGWGSNGYQHAMAQLGEKGVINRDAAQYGHAHNEFIDAFAKRGLIGLAVLLALYLIPMRLFAWGLQANDLSLRAVATAGVLLPVTYIDFGLSQAFFTHNSGVMMYAFMLAVLWGTYATFSTESKWFKGTVSR